MNKKDRLKIGIIFNQQRLELKEELDKNPFGFYKGIERIKAKKELLDSLFDKFDSVFKKETKKLK